MTRKSMVQRLFALTASAFVALSFSFKGADVSATDIGPAGKVDGVTDTVVSIPKSLKFVNLDATTSYGPGISYTYTIASGKSEDSKAYVTAGPVGGAKFKVDANGKTADTGDTTSDNVTILYSSDDSFTTSSTGVDHSQKLNVQIDLSKWTGDFNKPGVYSYKISDTTTTETLFNHGIERLANYEKDRYLYVYLINDPDDSSKLKIYSFELYIKNANSTSADDKLIKSPGYTTADDIYRTFDIRIQKIVEGSMGDKTHKFPFTITVNNKHESEGSNIKYMCSDAITTVESPSASVTYNETAESTVSVSLADSEMILLRGLSPKAKIAVTETNDTADPYEVHVFGSTDRTVGNTEIANTQGTTEISGVTYKTYSIAAGNVSDYDTKNSATDVSKQPEADKYRNIAYKNKYDIPSMTGLALRFAPYGALIGGGVLLLTFSRRKKKEQDDEFPVQKF